MKFMDLFESKYISHHRDVYSIDAHIKEVDDDFVDQYYIIDLDVDIKQYETFAQNAGEVIKNIFNDTHSIVVSNFDIKGMGYMNINSMKLTDRLNGGGSTILIGKLKDLLSYSRSIVIGMDDNMEEDMEAITSTVRKMNLPSPSECMTKIKRDHKLVTMATRKYDVKDINIELTLLPKISSVVNVVLNSTPENEDEESIGFKLAKSLKPYKVRPQINGGPIVGLN